MKMRQSFTRSKGEQGSIMTPENNDNQAGVFLSGGCVGESHPLIVCRGRILRKAQAPELAGCETRFRWWTGCWGLLLLYSTPAIGGLLHRSPTTVMEKILLVMQCVVSV